MYCMVWTSVKTKMKTHEVHTRHAYFLNKSSADDYFQRWEGPGFIFTKIDGFEANKIGEVELYPKTYIGRPKNV